MVHDVLLLFISFSTHTRKKGSELKQRQELQCVPLLLHTEIRYDYRLDEGTDSHMEHYIECIIFSIHNDCLLNMLVGEK